MHEWNLHVTGKEDVITDDIRTQLKSGKKFTLYKHELAKRPMKERNRVVEIQCTRVNPQDLRELLQLTGRNMWTVAERGLIFDSINLQVQITEAVKPQNWISHVLFPTCIFFPSSFPRAMRFTEAWEFFSRTSCGWKREADVTTATLHLLLFYNFYYISNQLQKTLRSPLILINVQLPFSVFQDNNTSLPFSCGMEGFFCSSFVHWIQW